MMLLPTFFYLTQAEKTKKQSQLPLQQKFSQNDAKKKGMVCLPSSKFQQLENVLIWHILRLRTNTCTRWLQSRSRRPENTNVHPIKFSAFILRSPLTRSLSYSKKKIVRSEKVRRDLKKLSSVSWRAPAPLLWRKTFYEWDWQMPTRTTF